jgi:hypothetical protein
MIKNRPKLLVEYSQNFDVGSHILFIIVYPDTSTEIYSGMIDTIGFEGSYYVKINNYENSIIFSKLNIDRAFFIKNIIGVGELRGSWPEVPTLDMLRKSIEALECFDEF